MRFMEAAEERTFARASNKPAVGIKQINGAVPVANKIA